MKTKIGIICIVLAIAGCAGISLYRTIAPNRSNLEKLSVGMSKEQVLQIMGTKNFVCGGMTINNPFRVTKLQAASRTYEIVFYVTSVVVDDNVIDENELTPLVFYQAKLMGWGWGYIDTIR